MEQGFVDVALRVGAVMAMVFANGFFVAAEFSLVTVRKTRIDQLIAEGYRAARTVRGALADPNSYIAATQLGITMTSLGLGWIGEPAVASIIEPAFAALPARLATATAHSLAVAIAFAIITSLHIVLGELAPKTVALQRAETTVLWVVKPTLLFMRLFWPFISLLNRTGRAVVSAFGLREPSGHSLVHSEEELKMLVTASQEAGVLDEHEEQMIHRVFGFDEVTAGQVMLPRTEMPRVAADASLVEVVEAITTSSQSYVAVYAEDPDEVIGTVQAKDILPALLRAQADFRLAAISREPLTVPETMSAGDVLTRMRRRKTQVAVVFDEYGGTAGMVTFDRLMERIVGDGGDESSPGGGITQLPDGAAIIDGLALVTDVNERFGLEIDPETYNTVGGFVLGRLGRRARIGDVVDINGCTMRVEALDGLRVERVILRKKKK